MEWHCSVMSGAKFVCILAGVWTVVTHPTVSDKAFDGERKPFPEVSVVSPSYCS